MKQSVKVGRRLGRGTEPIAECRGASILTPETAPRYVGQVGGCRLSAVIDWGGPNVGDPACDLQPTWNVFVGESRVRFLAELEVDDASWLRGRGWTLYQAVSALAYYWETNPGMIRQASYALAQVLADGSP